MPGPYAAAAHVPSGDLTPVWRARVNGLTVTGARVEIAAVEALRREGAVDV